MTLHTRANCGCVMKQTSLYMYSEGLTNSSVLLPSLDWSVVRVKASQGGIRFQSGWAVQIEIEEKRQGCVTQLKHVEACVW